MPIDFPENPLLLGSIELNGVPNLFGFKANFDGTETVESLSICGLNTPFPGGSMGVLHMFLIDDWVVLFVHGVRNKTTES